MKTHTPVGPQGALTALHACLVHDRPFVCHGYTERSDFHQVYPLRGSTPSTNGEKTKGRFRASVQLATPRLQLTNQKLPKQVHSC